MQDSSASPSMSSCAAVLQGRTVSPTLSVALFVSCSDMTNPSDGEQLLDRCDEQVGLERFDDPALGARLLGALDQGLLSLAGQHDHVQVRVLPALLDRLKHLQAVHARHVDIEDDQADVTLAADLREAVGSIARL